MTHQSQDKAPGDKVCGYEYTVKRGDSFYLIANRLGVPLRDLLEANSSINPARLMVGDVLCIPMEEDDAVQPAEPDTPPEADQTPSLPSPSEAAPQETEPAPAAPVPEAAAQPQPQTQPQTARPAALCAEANRYTVAQGETLADIQLRTGLNLHTLALANPDADLDDLEPGDVLCIPTENIPCPIATTFMLRQDDTLETVALRYNVSVGALLRANPCLAPGEFVEGVCITLPFDD